MAAKKRRIDPSCIYCKRGVPSARMDTVFCMKKGIVSPYHSCSSFSALDAPKEPPVPAGMNDSKDIFGTKRDVMLKRIEISED